MGLFGLGRKRITGYELAERISKLTLSSLTSPIVSDRLVGEVIEAGSPLDRESIIRECYYLLQFGTNEVGGCPWPTARWSLCAFGALRSSRGGHA